MVDKNDLFLSSEVRFVEEDDKHQYFNLKDVEYTSVSKMLERIKQPFDRNKISSNMAVSISKESGLSVEKEKINLLNEWDVKKDNSIKKGNFVHHGLEDYCLTGKYDPILEKPILLLKDILKGYYRFFPEQLLHSHTFKCAGTADLLLMRQNSKVPIIDIVDYKTNAEKGIQFDSIKRDDNGIILKHYNRYFLPPFDYLESCNFVLYSLQLSIYAYMIIERLGYRIGKLNLFFVDNKFNAKIIPVPFMYQEAKMICEMNINLKKLPSLSKAINVMPEQKIQKQNIIDSSSDGFDINNIIEDW